MNNAARVANPTWAKIPDAISELLETPWRFSLFRAMSLLEQHWAIDGEIESGISQRVRFKPSKELGFPAADVRACFICPHGSGVITLETSFLGLYGLDAAMPHYILEQAALDDDCGARTRQFLDMFNHFIYCHVFQAWKKGQVTCDGIGAQQFDAMLDAVLLSMANNRVHSGVSSLKQNSAAGLGQLLKVQLNLPCIEVNDKTPRWHVISTPSKLNHADSAVLGESSILGSRALSTGEAVAIQIGPVEEGIAKQLQPTGELGQQLYMLLQNQLASLVPWRVAIEVETSSMSAKKLGQQQILGQDTCLGDVSQKLQQLEFEQVQFERAYNARSSTQLNVHGSV